MIKRNTVLCFGILIILINIPFTGDFDNSSESERSSFIGKDPEIIEPMERNSENSIESSEIPKPTAWPPFKSDSPYRRVVVQLESVPLGVMKSQWHKSDLAQGLKSDKINSYYDNLVIEHNLFKIKLSSLRSNYQILWDYYNAFNGVGLVVDETDISRLQDFPGVKELHFDKLGQGALTQTVNIVKANEVWQLKNATNASLNGEGVVVAVLDTGIDYYHKNLGNGIGPSFKVIGGFDFVNSDTDPMDDNYHGTMVSGIIAASDGLSGVAPNASLLAYKVSDSNDNAWISDALAGIDRALDPDSVPATDDAADIICLSIAWFGTPYDLISQAVDNAFDSGTLPVVAAGNYGPDLFTVRSPGTAYKALTVGATDKSQVMADLSSRGPVGLGHIKPELVAPGINIFTTFPDNSYGTLTGTSAASPHVVGAAALLKQLHPEWGPEELRNAIVNNAVEKNYPVVVQGAGMLDISAAAKAKLRCTPDVLAFEQKVGGIIETTSSASVILNNTRSLQIDGTIEITTYYSADQELIELPSAVPVTNYIIPTDYSFSVSGNSTKQIDFTQNIPPGANEGYYWGKIKFRSPQDNLTVPFGFQHLDIDLDLGEWVVSSDTVRENERLKITNLTVTNGAKLTLNDVTIFISSKLDGLSELNITSGSSLIMNNCIVTNYNPSVYYNVSLHGISTIDNSRFSGMWGIYHSPFPGGINIYAEGTSVTNSTIFRCYTNGIFTDSVNNVLIADNHIHHNGGEGVLLWNSQNIQILRNNLSRNWWDGVGMTDSYAVVEDNEIHYNSYDGMWINKSSPLIVNNNVTHSGYWMKHDDSAGIKFQRGSVPIMEGNNFSDNKYFGFYINASSPIVFNNTIANSDTADVYITLHNQNISAPRFINSSYSSATWPIIDTSSSLTREWIISMRVTESTGPAVEGAYVRIFNNEDTEIAEVPTDETGRTPLIIATQYIRSPVITDYKTPYRLEINKSAVQNNSITALHLTSNKFLSASLTFPDVGISAVTHSPEIAYINETINFTLTLYNNVTEDIDDVNVVCLLDDFTAPFAEFEIDGLTAKSELNYTFSRLIINPGPHKISVTLNLPEDKPERNLVDNQMDYSFSVYSKPENLSIEILEKNTYLHELITFQASAEVTGSPVIFYQFSFSDGTISEWQENNTIQHYFSNESFASVSFRIRTDSGVLSNWSKEHWFGLLHRTESSGIFIEPASGGTILTTFKFSPTADLLAANKSISSYFWTFGDGTFSNLMTPNHEFIHDDSYNITLTIKYGTDGTSIMFFSSLVVENLAPEAEFFTSSTIVFVNDVIWFNANTTTDLDDDAASELTYKWQFGDGTEGTGRVVQHSYSEGNTYVVKLTVTDDDGARTEFSMNMTVNAKSTDSDESSTSGLSNVTIALIIVGVLGVILIAAAIVLFSILRRKKREGVGEEEEAEEEE